MPLRNIGFQISIINYCHIETYKYYLWPLHLIHYHSVYNRHWYIILANTILGILDPLELRCCNKTLVHHTPLRKISFQISKCNYCLKETYKYYLHCKNKSQEPGWDWVKPKRIGSRPVFRPENLVGSTGKTGQDNWMNLLGWPPNFSESVTNDNEGNPKLSGVSILWWNSSWTR